MQKEDEEQRYCTLFHIFYKKKKKNDRYFISFTFNKIISNRKPEGPGVCSVKSTSRTKVRHCGINNTICPKGIHCMYSHR